MNPNDLRSMDVSFCPVDDISYHPEKKKDMPSVRVVQVIPYCGVRTIYLTRRDYPTISNALDVKGNVSLSKFRSEEIQYISNGIPKTLTLIYSVLDEYQQPCVLLNGETYLFANACLIAGENFTDLTMDQCYGIVTTARAKAMGDTYSVCVDIRDNMDIVPRVVVDEE